MTLSVAAAARLDGIDESGPFRSGTWRLCTGGHTCNAAFVSLGVINTFLLVHTTCSEESKSYRAQ